jgi:hypothetical protein
MSMPGETGTSPDGSGLFAPSALQWLHGHGCRGIHRLPDVAPGDMPDWITVPVGRHGGDESGWRFGWRDADGRERRLLLAFDAPDALPPPARAALAGYLAFAGPCSGGDAGDGPAVLVDRDDVAVRIHDLRNGLNSLLMNVAVMTTKLPPEERSGRFATQAQADGERCAALLQALADALRPPVAPLSR